MAVLDELVTPSLTFEEILSDGSTLTNPAADGRRLFLGEDGLFHMIDSAGTVTDVGGGSAVTDATITTTDVTTNNASTSKHGWLKKLSNVSTEYMSGTGVWSTPAGGGGASLVAIKNYASGSNSNMATTSSATLADADATNLAVTFTAPASGNVLVRLSSMMDMTASNNVFWGLRESTTDVKSCLVWGIIGTARAHAELYLTGVSAGSHTYKWSFACASGTHHIMGGPTWGDAVMEVWAAP